VLFVYIPYFTKENKNLYKKYLITTFEVIAKKKKKCTKFSFSTISFSSNIGSKPQN
jgi:hypothetical protein